MIFPHLPVLVFKKSGFNKYGEPTYAPAKRELCAPVKLTFGVTHTTVRTDSAGSKGNAQEPSAAVVFLVRPGSVITLDDKVEVLGNPLRVTGTHQRYTVTGVFDHLEVHCEAWF